MTAPGIPSSSRILFLPEALDKAKADCDKAIEAGRPLKEISQLAQRVIENISPFDIVNARVYGTLTKKYGALILPSDGSAVNPGDILAEMVDRIDAAAQDRRVVRQPDISQRYETLSSQNSGESTSTPAATSRRPLPDQRAFQ